MAKDQIKASWLLDVASAYCFLERCFRIPCWLQMYTIERAKIILPVLLWCTAQPAPLTGTLPVSLHKICFLSTWKSDTENQQTSHNRKDKLQVGSSLSDTKLSRNVHCFRNKVKLILVSHEIFFFWPRCILTVVGKISAAIAPDLASRVKNEAITAKSTEKNPIDRERLLHGTFWSRHMRMLWRTSGSVEAWTDSNLPCRSWINKSWALQGKYHRSSVQAPRGSGENT